MLFRLRTPTNPLYAAEFRLMGWPAKPHELDLYRNYVLGVALIVIAVLSVPAYFGVGRDVFYLLSWALILGNVAATLVSDLYCILVAIDNLSRLVASGQWDLLRVTAMTEDNIIDAKTAIATIRARRATTIAIVMRILPIAALPMVGIIVALLSGDMRYLLASLTGTLAVVVFLFPVLAYVWVLEPGWQMSTLIACGAAISLKVRSQTNAVMLGFATAFLIRVAQLMLYLVLSFILLQIITPLVSTRVGLGMLVVPPLLVIAGVIVYLFHATVVRWSLRLARWAATKPMW
jgi:hypothetical protein